MTDRDGREIKIGDRVTLTCEVVALGDTTLIEVVPVGGEVRVLVESQTVEKEN